MIELVTVDVVNFRSFGEATFAPLGPGQGLTAVNGGNGTGKSSIATHALLWALYGVTPDGVNVKALRRQGSEGEVRVSVTFRHDGQLIQVTRALRGKNDTSTAAITVEGVEQTNVSVRAAAQWVEGRLGVDAEAFLTAFVVRQKELDTLVKARPAERRALIERLAGIDRLSTALSVAREEARRQATQAQAITVEADPEEATATAMTAETESAAAAASAEDLETLAAAARTSAAAAEEAVRLAEQHAETLAKMQRDVERAQAAYEQALTERDRLVAAATGADLLPDAEAAAADAQTARRAAEHAVQSAASAVAQANREQAAATEARGTADQAHQELARRKTLLHDAEAHLATYPETLVELTAAATQREQESRDAWTILQAEADRLDSVLQALSAAISGGHAECPTCAQGLAHPEQLLAGLDADKAARATQAREARRLWETHAAEAAAVAREQGAQEDAARQVDAARAAVGAAEKDAADWERRASQAEEAAETAAEAAHAARQAAEEAETSLPRLRDEERQALTSLRKAETAQEAAEAVPQARAAAARAAERLSAAEHALQEAHTNCASEDVPVLRRAAQEALSRAHEASLTAQAARTQATLAARDAAVARDLANRAAAAAETKKAALRDAEIAASVASSLEEFRLDRLARLAPELAEVASDVISTMTDGRYTAVELDEDFTPTLVEADTGHERSVSWLSGGEESAVALALRLAIGDVVAGQRTGVLILDEVLTAHDKERRVAVMSAIRALPHRQVITINHASEATDQVDLIAQVTPTPEGSVIEHMAAGGPAADSAAIDLGE